LQKAQIFLAILFGCVLSSCNFNSNSATQNKTDKESSKNKNISINQGLVFGKDLLAANDCAACHQEKESIIGPSYIQIAERYSSKDIPILAEKIIKGGKGNWGETPMTAHPSLSDLEATEMVNYILKMK
jgi:cytochrome c